MKSLSVEEIQKLGPCWLETAEGRKRFRRIGSRKERWSALDVLDLPKEDVSSEDKLWLVLREEFLNARTLHLFACEAAEQALERTENPDLRSIEAIRMKRLWLDGKATNDELAAAGDAAWSVSRAAVRDSQIKILLKIMEREEES